MMILDMSLSLGLWTILIVALITLVLVLLIKKSKITECSEDDDNDNDHDIEWNCNLKAAVANKIERKGLEKKSSDDDVQDIGKTTKGKKKKDVINCEDDNNEQEFKTSKDEKSEAKHKFWHSMSVLIIKIENWLDILFHYYSLSLVSPLIM